MADFVPNYEASASHGLAAPRNTPREIVGRLNKATNAALADPKISERIVDLGGTPIPGSPDEFGKLIAAKTEKWGNVVKFSGARPD